MNTSELLQNLRFLICRMDHLEFDRIALAVHHQKPDDGTKALDFAIFPVVHLEQAIVQGKRYFSSPELQKWLLPIELFITGLIQKLNAIGHSRKGARTAVATDGASDAEEDDVVIADEDEPAAAAEHHAGEKAVDVAEVAETLLPPAEAKGKDGHNLMSTNHDYKM